VRKLYYLIPALAVVVIALVVLTNSPTRFSKIQRLPDGSILRIVSISYGTKHNYIYSPKAWQSFLARKVPYSWTAGLGSYIPGGGSVSQRSLHGEANLAVFTICDQKSSTSFSGSSRVVVFDQQGNAFDACAGGGTVSFSDGIHHRTLQCWTLPAFPRRTKTLGLSFLELGGDGKTWQQVAEFKIQNPTSDAYPVWRAEPWPKTKTDGDLAVTLTDFKTAISWEEPMRAATNSEIAATRMTFHAQQTGRTNQVWRPKSIEISDATGNRWIPNPGPFFISFNHERDVDQVTVKGALWPGEAAWKLRVEFSRTADFDPDELWTVHGIMVPGATQVIDLHNSNRVHGIALKLVAITGEKAEQPGSLKWVAEKGHPNISVRALPVPKDRRWSLVRAVDHRGTEVEVHPATDWGNGETVYGLTIQPGAKSLDCTFALHKSRWVEFLAKPEFVSPKSPTTAPD